MSERGREIGVMGEGIGERERERSDGRVERRG